MQLFYATIIMPMKQKIALLTVFAGVLPVFIAALILYSLYLLSLSNRNTSKLYPLAQYQALPAETTVSSVKLDPQDARIAALQEFFSRYNSPLLPYAEKFVSVSDKYRIDYRLLPAIAMQESNLCLKIPKNSYNCWGFGIYGGKVRRFSGYDDAIEVISKALATEYKQKGFTDPNTIGTKYTPGSNGSWAFSVNYFMASIGASL